MDKIQEILAEIKNIGDNKVQVAQLDSLKEAIDQRNAEVDAKFGTMEEMMEKSLAKMADAVKDGVKSAHQEKQETARFKSASEFYGLVKNNDMSIKDLAEGAGNTGGYLVPDEYRADILKIMLEKSVVRSNGATILRVNSPKVQIPALDVSNNTSGNLYGGAAAYWGNENTSITESNPTFDNINLEVKKLTAYVEDSNELEQDAITNMGDLITQMYGDVLAFEEDYAFLNGDGVNKPLGILNAPCLVSVSRTSASLVKTADVINMMARFRGDLNNAVWVVNQTTLPSIHKLADDNGNYIWHPAGIKTIAMPTVGTLYGLPIVISEKAQAVGTKGDFYLADFKHYLIAERGDLRIDYSDHYKFQSDQKAYRCVTRVDGQPWLKSAITPRNGSDTLSPFVTIA